MRTIELSIHNPTSLLTNFTTSESYEKYKVFVSYINKNSSKFNGIELTIKDDAYDTSGAIQKDMKSLHTNKITGVDHSEVWDVFDKMIVEYKINKD